MQNSWQFLSSDESTQKNSIPRVGLLEQDLNLVSFSIVNKAIHEHTGGVLPKCPKRSVSFSLPPHPPFSLSSFPSFLWNARD